MLVVVASGFAFAANSLAKRPNFIFIFADDLGWGDLGCYGHPQLKTPHLDRLAKQGTLFTQFYVNASVCSPSRCAFMTGQYPARHKIHGHYAEHALNAARGMNDWLDPKVPNVAALLQQAGYKTAHFGKWHLGSGAVRRHQRNTDSTTHVPSIAMAQVGTTRTARFARSRRLPSWTKRSASSPRTRTNRFTSTPGCSSLTRR